MFMHCQLQVNMAGQSGITWHELLLLAAAWAPDDTCRTAHSTARASKTLASVLAAFKRDVVRMFKIFVHPVMHNILRTSYQGSSRLQSLGYHNHVQHLSFLPCLCQQATLAISIAMLNITKTMPNKVVRSIRENKAIMLKQRSLTGQGSLKWHQYACEAREHLIISHPRLVSPYTPTGTSHMPHHAPTAAITRFVCPAGHYREATTPAFDPLRPSRNTWCSQCKKYLNGRKWLCPCGTNWALCPHHVTCLAPKALPNRKRSATAVKSMTNEEAAHKLAKIEPQRCSRLILPTKLAARFPHLARQH